MRTMGVWLALWLAASVAGPALSADVGRAASPDGRLVVTVVLDNDGRPGYRIDRAGRPLIAESRLGFLLTDAPKLERGFVVGETATAQVDTTWEQPWGEWRRVRDHHRELRVTLREKGPLARAIRLEFRVFDDGVGFRTVFPEQPNLKTVNIAEELTQFAVTDAGAGNTAWWIPAFEWNREEYLYRTTTMGEVGTAQTPMTVRTAGGTHIAFHEAALVDYSAMNLAKVDGGLFKAVLTPSASGPKVSRDTPFATPWRTLQIADDAAGLYRSRMILNLNEPNKLGDVSWVKPRKYVGIWWGMHLDTQSWASGPKHGATTANARAYVDFAAANGFGGLLIEGWNVGWDGDWFGQGQDFSFTQSYPDFDLPAVAAYARSKGVTLVGHHETSGNIAHYEAQMGAGFDLYARHGVDSVKTGYVADAGGIQAAGGRREWHEGQEMARHHLRVATEAARRRIAINAHEPIKDSGLRRTYPNIISREGARGMEYSAWGSPGNPPEHEAMLVFTRMLAGPMDYTPGILSLKGRGGIDLESTIAKQLALYVVLYSPIQMVADLPENYARYPDAMKFIRGVAVDWDDTRVLAGAVGDHAVFARRARGGAEWFLGAVGDEQARVIDITLDFLDAGRAYTAEIYRDGPDADYRKASRHSIVIEQRTVRRGDKLTLALAPGGGQAIRFAPAGRRAR